MDRIKKIKKHILCASYFIILFSLFSEAFAEIAPKGVMDATKDGLHSFLKLIPTGELQNYGFAPEDPLAKAHVGTPFRVYTITPSALSNYSPGDTVSSLLSPTGMWYFPIMVNSNIRAILTVDRLNGTWRAVALGQASLARELEEVLQQWPRSKGYEPLLVMVFQAKSYFFTVPQKDDYNLTPFIFDGKGFGAEFFKSGEKYESTFRLPDIIKKLKTAVDENIRQLR